LKTILKDKKHSVSIHHLGAELESFKKDNTNYIWTIDQQYWNKTSPVLFPIVGRLKNDSYHLNGIEYILPRHGFARNYEFDVIEKNENSVAFSLKNNEETIKIFPFEFELQLKYVLENNKLTLTYSVFNNSKEKMPFNIGAHPAFSIPTNFEDYSLQFNKEETLESHLLENELFNGKTININSEKGKIPLTYSLFETDALVFKHLESNEISVLKNNNPYIKVNFEGFPFLGIWTKQNAPFICIEPWYGHADEESTNGIIKNKKGIQLLDSKEYFTTCFSIEIT
jgi:galactose mutarotase-like enzyme